jgi:predicted  nucleic acid-binding Zn-ribbon protein
MIGKSLWKNLKKLVEVDKRIISLGNKIADEKRMIEQSKGEVEKIRKNVKNLEEDYNKARLRIEREEERLDYLKNAEETKKRAIDLVSNEKEFNAMRYEISALSLQRSEQENIVVKAWHEADEAKNRLEEEGARLQTIIEATEEKVTEMKSKIAEYEKMLEKEKALREVAVKSIPAEWLSRYEKMRERVDDPVVPVLNSSCSACYYSIIRKDLQKLKKEGGIVLCRNCYRFLYYDAEEAEENDEASF